MKLFQPEDFMPVYGTVIDDVMIQTLTNLANAKLEQQLKAAPVVYGCFRQFLNPDGSKFYMWAPQPKEFGGEELEPFTHQARLVDIREMGK